MLVRIASLATVIGVVMWARPTTTVVIVTQPAPPPLVIPVPMPPMVVTIAAPAPPPLPPAPTVCPAPRTDAPAHVEPRDLPAQITHVTPAPTNPMWIAAWSPTDVFASYDGGATFARVLAGTDRVRDVTFDCFGRALAMRGDRIGIHDQAAHTETWHAVPGLAARDTYDDDRDAVLAGGGPDLAVLARAARTPGVPHLAASTDGGATWTARDAATFWESPRGAQLRETADRTLAVMVVQPDCMTSHVWFGEAPISLATAIVETDGTGMSDGDTIVSYAAAGGVSLISGQWRQRGDEAWKPIEDLPAGASPYATSAIPGALPAVVLDGQFFRIVDGHARDLHLDSGEASQIEAIDRAARVWAVYCGQPLVLGREPPPHRCGADI